LFTGIIQEKGKFIRRIKGSTKYQLQIEAEKVLKGAKKGDSIAVNGVCLTAVEFGDNYFKADVMPETLNSTNLGDLERGESLNLEQSLQPTDYIGGHFVSGHVDGTALLKNIKREKNAFLIDMEISQEIEKFVVKKGSIAVNGISLTVMEISSNIMTVSIIPETWSETNIAELKIGDKINIETDMLGKYVYKMLEVSSENSSISKDFLAENGFV